MTERTKKGRRNRTFIMLSRAAGTWHTRVFWMSREMGIFSGSLEYCTNALETLAGRDFRAPGALLAAIQAHGAEVAHG